MIFLSSFPENPGKEFFLFPKLLTAAEIRENAEVKKMSPKKIWFLPL
jgi:hypothetical protein